MAEMHNAEVTSTASAHEERGIGHVVPFQVLVAVFVTLLVLTFATVAATGFDLGPFNLWLAMGIATIKASLVALYFMHLRYDHPFHGLILVTGLCFLALFLGLVLLDTFQYQPDILNW
ncbi:MAG: cytochrome C oxidase subunit IV family protein [Pirellulaceae bacterium]